ncbi:hypothetical protein CK203_029418 [Vitis vinifera]|uniref:Uncharacterized protein n=1 Tax=Vitis vinifera TaxID=29760 RepID=A0A438HX72_VITVI|nr:hypothetical protein CK203_029418 [Vitis vinifera]
MQCLPFILFFSSFYFKGKDGCITSRSSKAQAIGGKPPYLKDASNEPPHGFYIEPRKLLETLGAIYTKPLEGRV